MLKLRVWKFLNEELSGDSGGSSGGVSSDPVVTSGLAEISESLFESGEIEKEEPAKEPPAPVQAPTPAAPAPAPTPAPAPVTDPAAKPSDPAASNIAPAPGAYPKTWRQTPELQAKWATLDPDLKAEVARREDDMYKGLDQYKADASIGKSIKQITAPYDHILRHHNINPLQQIQGLMKAHHDLAMGTPEMRVAMFRQLAADYNVDLTAAATEAPWEDPQVKALRLENQRLQSEQQRITNESRQSTTKVLEQQLDGFFARFPDAKELGLDMVPFVNQGFTLEEAREKAMWVNPVTRAKLLERQQADAAEASRKAEADRVAAARAATSANVKTSSRSGTATGPTGSMEDTMMETLQAIKARG